MQRPEENEFHPYFKNYLNLVEEGEFATLFHSNMEKAHTFFNDIPEEKHIYRYAEGKWTPKQVLMHIIDTERVFAYRAFVSSRFDNKMNLQSYDDELYAKNTDVSERSMNSIVNEFLAVRRASKVLFENVNEEQSKFINDVSGNPVSARAMGYIMIGHVNHHMNIINERYL